MTSSKEQPVRPTTDDVPTTTSKEEAPEPEPGAVVIRSTADPSAASTELFETGSVHTSSVRDWRNPEPSTTCVAHFATTRNAAPPTIRVGLDALDLDVVRVAARFRSVADNSARIEMSTWGGTHHFGSGCAWLRIPAGECDLQWGSLYTLADAPQRQTYTDRIVFGRPYAAPPKVVVFLTSLETNPNAYCRVSLYTTDVTPAGFTLHVSTWADTVLHRVGASWLAHSADRPDMCSGTFRTTDVRPHAHLQPYAQTAGRAAFWNAQFDAPPKVFAALNMLDMSHPNARVQLRTENVTTTGMDWRCDTWEDSVLHEAGASFLAFAQ